MKRIIFVFSAILFLLIGLFNQDLKAQSGELTVVTNMFDDNTLDVSLYLKRTGTVAWALGTSDFLIDYNNNALLYQTYYNCNPIWNSGNYMSMYTSNFWSSHGQSLEVSLLGKPGVDVPTTATIIGTLRFHITNHTQTAVIHWNTSLGVILDENSNTPAITFTNPPDAPLPVTLNNFNFATNNNNVKLIWSTTKETNNKGFDMERKSTTNNDWSKIGYVEGKGTTNAVTNYAFTDQKLQSGKYNYRIKQVDINGNYTYFNLNGDIEIGIPQKFDVSQNYPNPFNPVTKIDYQIPTDGFVSMKLYDMLGREVKSVFSDNQKAGYYSIKIDGSSLASGMYFCIINLNSPGKSFTKNIKLMLVK